MGGILTITDHGTTTIPQHNTPRSVLSNIELLGSPNCSHPNWLFNIAMENGP
jgi:hypothetical protein